MEVLDMNNKAIDESKVALKSSDPNNLTEEDKKHVSNIRNRTAFNEAYKRS